MVLSKFLTRIMNFFAKFFPSISIQREREVKAKTEMKDEENSDVLEIAPTTSPSTDSATHLSHHQPKKLTIIIAGLDGSIVEGTVSYYSDESENKPQKIRKTPIAVTPLASTATIAVTAVASTVIAAGVTVISTNSALTLRVKVLWYTVLASSLVAPIASVGAFLLKDKRPKVAHIMEKIGVPAVVLSVIGMAITSLPNNLMWVGAIPCLAFLLILAAAS